MKRREFLAAGVTLSGAAAARRFGLFQPTTRAAVVVGIDKVGDLPKLRAAAAGATAMSGWLAAEGFDVTALTDGAGPVRFSDFFAAVKKYVDNPALAQLVIYFAGHGFVNSYSEHWLLSEA